MVMLQQMIVLFLLMLIGVFLRKRNVLDTKTQKNMSTLIVDVANPCMIINSGIQEGARIGGYELVQVLLAILVVYGLLILFAPVIPRLLGADRADYGIYKIQTVFTNMGFMGLPLAAAVYGSEVLLYLTFFLLPFNVLFYTYGYHALLKTEKNDTVEDKNRSGKWKQLIQNILNVGVISCFLAFVVYFGNIQLPYIIRQPMYMMAQLPAPISMILIGASLAEVDWKKALKDLKLILFALINLLLLPVIIFAVTALFVNNQMLLYACMITLATPVGSATVMLAKQKEKNVEFASKAVALTSFLSIITLPVVTVICEWIMKYTTGWI